MQPHYQEPLRIAPLCLYLSDICCVVRPHAYQSIFADACTFPVQTSISLPFITATADGPKHIETNLSRAKFEELASDLLDRCRIPVEQALKDANLGVSDLNEVILVGGSTRIPAVQVGSENIKITSVERLVLAKQEAALESAHVWQALYVRLTSLLLCLNYLVDAGLSAGVVLLL